MTVNDKIVVYRTIYSILNGFNVSHIFDVALKHPYRQKKNVPSFRALFSNDNIFLYRTTDFYSFFFSCFSFILIKVMVPTKSAKKP